MDGRLTNPSLSCPPPRSRGPRPATGLLACLVLGAGLAACAPRPHGQGEFHDPYEAENRIRHEINRSIDRAILRPSSRAYGGFVPPGLREAIGNVAETAGLPQAVANGLLQGRVGNAVHNTLRFALNATVGLAGLVDVAADLGLEARPTDFGETLFVWGVPEGAYVEVIFLGPATERDFAGRVVDFALNPLRFVLPDELSPAITAATIAARVGDRYRFGDFVDDILYRSADSYAQARLLYLQNRRFRLGDVVESEAFDPYEDLLLE
jgi:phospholipid-binding lipoprotein MlaA